jgi:hypothetical protein
VFLGDPIMPIYLTKAATDQNYFPEWIITGTVLTDTTVFGRLYDQKQWAHAFGISSLPLPGCPWTRARPGAPTSGSTANPRRPRRR